MEVNASSRNEILIPRPGIKVLVEIVLLPHHYPDQKAGSEISFRLRDFRLESLQLAPDAFASSYQHEKQFTEDLWRQRLENPYAQHIIAVMGKATDSESNRDSLGLALKSWAGMIVVHHRSSSEDIEPARSPWESTPSPKSMNMTGSTSFHLNGFSVHPSARRVGLGQRLIQAALQYTRDAAAADGLRYAKVTVIVDSSNPAALAIYEKCGFVTVKESAYQVGEGPPRVARNMIQEIMVQEA
ncbi:MAG: hypothetical protein LQ347_006515 [Umbilicaria vellea]|nr:MAG: hypothetical protein LQ347_006515 [Umbilicaria vellea]